MPHPLDSFGQLIDLITESLHHFWALLLYLDIPIPLGMIGAWRWGIWGLRRFIGHWYRAQPPNGYWASTAVITPVYNEDPQLFRIALRSWAANCPQEIIAVIDHTDTRCMVQFREFEEEIAGQPIQLKMLITKTPGKRPALADGILVATSAVVFLVDSDTIWDLDLLPKALAPFFEPEVGGVTVRQRVWQPHSTAQRIFDVYLDIRYIDEIRFLTAFGDAVTCLSGRTAIYRRAVALTALEDLMEETFWGRRVISGDDKALTLAVQSRGWKVRYQDNTCVYTPGATVMKDFLKQRLRWARNSWRADLKALGSRWAWRKPFLAFHLFDRLFQPFTTLIAPLYLGFAIYHQNWPAIWVLLSWWSISRTIKIWPHLQRDWRNIRILPWYITFNYWSAVTKIYAFFTMNQQGWITRWSRGGKAPAWLQWLQAAPSYTATALTVALVAIFVNLLHQAPIPPATPALAQADTVLQRDGFGSPPRIGSANFAKEAQSTRASISVASAAQQNSMHWATNQLCVLAGKASGSCTTYLTPQTSRATSWRNIGRGLLHFTREWLEQILPAVVNGQEAQWPPINWARKTESTTAQPNPLEPTIHLLCVVNSDKEPACTSYTVK